MAAGLSDPTLSPNYTFMFKFEDDFQHQSGRAWMQQNWHTAFYWIAGYMVLVFGGKAFMSNRQPYDLRIVLTVWNISLAVFSILGTIRTLPEMIHILYHFGFYASVCNASYVTTTRVSAFWTFAFALSKVPELGDTLFIIARKQKLIFLHWYHHITVLLFTWYSYGQYISVARWYVNMNYAVHSLMYSYYGLRSAGYKIDKRVAMLITMSQIAQMAVGLYVTAYATYVRSFGRACVMPEGTAALGLAMYASYFLLFAKFFVSSYGKKPTKSLDKTSTKIE